MKFSIYTSCSINYLPKARALAESLAEHQPDARLTLCLNDVVPDWLDLAAEPFDRIWTPGDLGYDPAWIFQHNVMELCTAVKGRALCRMIDEDEADYFVYFDPDVYLFHELAPIAGYMEGASVGLVPHILTPEETDIGVRMTEMSVTEHGIYNLGHLIVRPDANGRAFAEWWGKRLDRYCFDDRERGLFTDQRWVDLAPAIFDGVRVLRVPTLDVASWNLAGRTIAQRPGANHPAFTVDGQPLITYHFSGTGPNGTHRRVREIFDPANAATAEIERIYEAAIARHGQAMLENWPSGFDFFDDATPVTARARKLYRQHPDLQEAFPDPYACRRDALCYVDWLRENRPGAVDGLILADGALERAFRDIFDEDYYLGAHPMAAEAVERGRDASGLAHYCRIGSRLFLDPSPFFVSSYYYERARDYDRYLLYQGQGTMRGTLLWHYLKCGLRNGIEPIEFFDSRWYVERYPDIEAAMRTGRISTPFAHFQSYGSAEGRDPGPAFVGQCYIDATPEAHSIASLGKVRGAFGAFVHLGGVAGRIGAAL